MPDTFISDTWKQWEGQVVDANFPLSRYLGGSEHSAVFLTERREGDGREAAAIKIIPLLSVAGADGDGEVQLSRWRLAAGLSHPHLIQLFDFGKCELGGVPVLYIVTELAEESLAQVLAERPLTADEAGMMLDPAAGVLAYLHHRGLVHGAIKPTNILANGDQLKLASDTLSRAGDSSDGRMLASAYNPPENSPGIIPVPRTMSPAGDVWSLGMTLVETLTQHLPTQTAGQGALVVPENLPEPFRDIARHCLLPNPVSRCSVAEIAARMREGSEPISQVRNPSNAPKAIGPSATRSGASGARPEVREARAKQGGYGVWIGVGLVLIVILVGVSLLRHRSETGSAMSQNSGAVAETTVQPSPQTSPQTSPQETPGANPVAAPGARAAATTHDPVAIARAPVETAHNVAPGVAPNVAKGNLAETHEVKETKSDVARAAEGSADGDVVQKVLPDVPARARDTIEGTVKVAVKVDVDPSGAVKGAEIETAGPSKYFARLALEAAQRWKFAPAGNLGGNASNTWTLRFQFNRSGTTVVPTQDARP